MPEPVIYSLLGPTIEAGFDLAFAVDVNVDVDTSEQIVRVYISLKVSHE